MAKRSHSQISSILNSLSRTNESTFSAIKAEEHISRVTAARGGQAISVEETSVSPDTAIADFLQQMRSAIDEKGFGAQVEVELRFGKIASCLEDSRCRPSQDGVDAAIVLSTERMRDLGAKFVPGVGEQEFPTFLKGVKHLLKSDAFTEHLEKQNVHCFADSRRVIEDIDVNTNETKPLVCQVKEKLGSINIFLPHCQYDCRVSVSCEFPPRELPNGLEGFSAPESVRRKDRRCAVGREMRVDLTEVHVQNTNKKTFEVEIELLDGVVQEWLNQTDENHESEKSAAGASALLWKMVKYFMPNAGQAFKKSWNFPAAPEVQNAYQGRLGVRNKFCGTMPVGFARWHIPLVKRREYYVSEKTDGVRYFLVVAAGHALMVDRSNLPFTTPGLDMLSLILPEGTVLDGEFVFHQKDKRYVFMVFDIIATGPSSADSHVQKPFVERLRILNDFLSEDGPYCAGIREHHLNRNAVLLLLRKKWVPMRQISDVFRQIERVKKRDQSVGRIYCDDKRVHFTDGVVFCPNTPYIPNTHREYLKWKWSDLITVDFLATLDDNQVKLSCGGPHNTHIDLDSIVVLDPRDVATVQKLLQRLPRRSAVLEFAFDADKGMWHYKCHRSDKDCANYIRTVLGSLMNMAEAISEEELQYRLVTGAQGEQWNEQMKRMRRSLLEHALQPSGH